MLVGNEIAMPYQRPLLFGSLLRKGGNHAIDPGSQRLLERMLFFSDGVFAIVLTLLVLDLRLPPGITEGNLFRGVLSMSPKLAAFATTFCQ